MSEKNSEMSVSISDLKRNPELLIKQSKKMPIAILESGQPVAYLVSAAVYEQLIEWLDDQELARLAEERQQDSDSAIKVDLDDL